MQINPGSQDWEMCGKAAGAICSSGNSPPEKSRV